MPSTSKKQRNFMAAVAHSPAFAKKVGVPQSVGQDFNKADKGRKFSQGGPMAMDKADIKQDKAIVKKAIKMHDKQEHKGSKGTNLSKLKKGGVAASGMGKVKTAAPSINGVATKGKTKGTMVTMKRGGKCI